MKKSYLFFILILLMTVDNLKASNRFAECSADVFLCCALTACNLPRLSLNALFFPGQAFMAIRHWDANPTSCQIEMDDFKNIQLQRCCMFTRAACALGAGSLVCSACGSAGAAAVASSGFKICATGACVASQIPYKFSFEEQTGKSK